MATVLGDLIVGTREFLTQGFRSLPVILGNAVLLLGLVQGNFNLLFFFVGMFILTPTAVIVLNGVLELLFSYLPEELKPFWLVPNAGTAQCAIFTVGELSSGALNGIPSLWMSMMIFFFSYLMLNAYDLYTRAAVSKAPKVAVDARKSQAVVSMAIVGITGLVVTLLRYGMSSCETALGVLVSAGLGFGLAKGWFAFMRNCGMGRLDDLFGISNRMMPLQSYESPPQVTCMEIPKSKQ